MYIYNTMSRKKELFVPQKEGQVSMYACGPTVYFCAELHRYRR